MKSFFILLTSAISVAIGSADGPDKFRDFPAYSRNGVSIYTNISGKGFDPNLPRSKATLTPKEAIENADRFLRAAYGKGFTAPIFKVSLERYMGAESEYVWCWVIGYFDPAYMDDADSARIFFVILDFKGVPLMRVDRSRTNGPDKNAEQAGAGQPATQPESKSEGGDKPQPEAEGRSR